MSMAKRTALLGIYESLDGQNKSQYQIIGSNVIRSFK